jgi:3-oxoacyl-[acyl-carrier-protein] synthase-3
VASAAPASWRAADPVDLSTRAGITGLGMAVPSGVQASAAVEQRLGVEPGWIESRTGVAERHVADPADSLSDLAAAAGRSALEQAGVAARDVEMVIVATTTADQLLPNAAPLVAHAVGADRAGAIDVGAACTGFLSALSLAAGLVDSRRAATVLVVGADLMSRITDPSDRSTAGLFADGAGAAVVSAGAGGLIHPAVSGADAATGAALLCVDHDERLVRMNGLETYRHAVARLSESALQAVAAAELELEDIDLFVFHQANTRILGAVGQRLAVDPERVVDCIGAFGNTSAATVPIALCVAQDEGRLEPGARVLLGAFGAGFTWSAAVVEIGGPDV